MSCPIAAITTAGSKAAISPKLTFGWRGLMSALWVKRTFLPALQISANDPKRTFTASAKPSSGGAFLRNINR